MIASKRIFLVAHSPNGAENLSLQYLAAPLASSHFRPEVLLFQNTNEATAIARQLAASKCLFVGVSIPSGESALQILPFIHLLRKQGYNGVICVGGVFATLAQKKILQTAPIDAVISHDGETAIVEFAQALKKNKPIHHVPGVSTPRSDGPPARARCREQVETVPLRTTPKRYMGVPSAKICASRGCHGTCTYCGLKAVRDTAAQVHSQQNHIFRRPTQSIANEMADLYRHHKVRFFHFVDENLLPPNSEQAAAFIHDLCDELDARGVIHRAVSMMMRADVVSPGVRDALQRLGLVRSLLGVESNRDAGLKHLGRHYSQQKNDQAVRLIGSTGAAFHYNLLLIHPHSTAEQIKTEIDSLGIWTNGLMDPQMVQLYEGTTLFRRVQKEGRVQGGPYLWHYWPEDPQAKRFAKLYYLLRRDAHVFSTLTAFMYDTLGALAVHRQLGYLRQKQTVVAARQRELIYSHNQLWFDLLHQMWHRSKNPNCIAESHDLIESFDDAATMLLQRTWQLRHILEQSSNHSMVSDIFYVSKSTAAAALLAMGLNTACHQTEAVRTDTETDTVSVINETDTTTNDTSLHFTDSDTQTDDSDTIDSDTIDSDTQTWEVCSLAEAQDESLALLESDAVNNCGDDCTYAHQNSCTFELDADGRIIGILDDPAYGDERISLEYIDCVIEALADQRFPCIAEHQPIWHHTYVALE